MNIVRLYRGAVGTLLLIFAAALTPSAFGARLVEDTFEVLQTRTGSYTNVTVTTKAKDYIFILHASGMTSLKVGDLPAEIRQQLGYVMATAQNGSKTNRAAAVAAREINQVNQNLKPLEDAWMQRVQWRGTPIRIGSEVLLTLLVILVLCYLFFCYCCHLICLKTNNPGGFLVWVPGFQMIPLLRAAEMSPRWFLVCLLPGLIPVLHAAGVWGWWIVAFCAPVLSILMQVVWSLNIVKARGKGMVWAILLILPFTSLIAFLYLAFSSSSPPEITTTKFQTRALQTA
jgi:hypothetical protein